MAAGDVLQIDATGTFQKLAPVGAGSLSNTGVSAGSYGDATHVGAFTVNAQGQLTAASSVAISGGGGTSGLVTVYTSTLGVAAASIDTGAGGIPSGHGTLFVQVVARTSDAAASVSLAFRVNNDSGGTYDAEWLYGNNAAPTAAPQSAATAWFFIGHGAGGGASYPGIAWLTMPAYDGTTFRKVGVLDYASVDPTAADSWSGRYALGWRNTAPISRLAVFDNSGGNLIAGSSLTIYGTS